MPLYEAEQDPVGKMNVFLGVARLERSLGHVDQAADYYRRVLGLAERLPGFGDHPVTQGIREEYQQMLSEEPTSEIPPVKAQQLVQTLVDWLQTPDWAASESYLQAHQAELLTAEAEALLQLLLQQDPDQPVLEQHLAILRAARAEGIQAVYQQIQQILRENNSDA